MDVIVISLKTPTYERRTEPNQSQNQTRKKEEKEKEKQRESSGNPNNRNSLLHIGLSGRSRSSPFGQQRIHNASVRVHL